MGGGTPSIFSPDAIHSLLENIKKLISDSKAKNIHLVESKEITTRAEAFEHFENSLKRGLEGTIIKSFTDGWKNGKPTYQMKMKLELEVDLEIVGLNKGGKGTKNEGKYSSFYAKTSDGKLMTKPQGLSEDLMDELTSNGQEHYIGMIIQVKCNGITQASKSDTMACMYPAFQMFRPDKKIANSLAECLEIETAALLI